MNFRAFASMWGLRRLVGAAVVLACTGCATAPNADPRDPWEPFNRGVFAFNNDLDRVIFKPSAEAYRAITPRVVRLGVTNFFGNLDDMWSFVNTVLQAKPQPSATNFMRVAVNTVMGIGGVFDVASEMGLLRQREDFGQTLGHWGVEPGPYMVLPVLGSSTLRDTVGLPVDWAGDVAGNLSHVPTRNSLKALDLLDTRAGLLSVTDALDQVALDKYSFARDAHLQRRQNAVLDGDAPDAPVRRTPPR